MEKIIQAIKNNRFLYYGTLYSQYDNKWENEEKIIVYNINKKSKKGKKYTKDMFDKKCIDVNFNYGRTLRLNNIGFVAGWKMWFGIDFPSIIKEELASLNLEHKNTSTNITEVRLFEKLISDNYEINRPIQQQFLELGKNKFRNMPVTTGVAASSATTCSSRIRARRIFVRTVPSGISRASAISRARIPSQ